MSTRGEPLKIGIAGLGAIGLAVARRIDAGELPGLAVAAVAVRDAAKAKSALAGLRSPPRLTDLAGLAEVADVVVECLPPKHFADVARPAIERGRIFMPLSVGTLIDHMDLVELARQHGRAHRRADRRAARPRRRARHRRGQDRAPSPSSPASRRRGSPGRRCSSSAAFRSRTSRRRCACSQAARARRSPAFPPTSTWPWPCRSRASGPTARRSRSGPTPA